MRLQGAFHVPDQPKYGLVRIHPSSRRLVPYMTGGLQVLYGYIDNRIVPESHGMGAYTDEKGRFRPEKGMPLLAKRYRFAGVIGKGQSSISIKAVDVYCDDKLVAIKVLHQHNYTLGFQESDCIRRLNTADPFCLSPTFRMHNTFCFDGHYCMVFELLRPEPLHSYFKNIENPEKLDKIRLVTVQLLKALGFLQQQNVLHADLKPENILLSKEDDLNSLKVVDFGNAIHCVHAELSLYYDDFELQTLLYRAPEVMFGQPFGLEADMWSLGCILAELYYGQSLFFAKDKIGVLQKIVEIMGPLPETVFQRGKYFSQFRQFTTRNSSGRNSTQAMMNHLRCYNYAFCNFLVRLLCYNPAERLTIAEAACHPFLAPVAGVAYFLPRGSFREYPQVFVDKRDLIGQPIISPDVERMSLDPISLLKRGTNATTPTHTRQIAEVIPMQHSHSLKSALSTRGHSAPRSSATLQPFTFEQNNNQLLLGQNLPQPRPAHSGTGAVPRVSRDVEAIDLTQSSPQPSQISRNLQSVGVSPKNGQRKKGQGQTNRKRPRNENDTDKEFNGAAYEQTPSSSKFKEGSTVAPQTNRPVTDMFRSWENSMSKYIERSQNPRPWSENVGQVVATTMGKSLGVATTGNSCQRSRNRIEQYHGANRSSGNSELRSYALQPNRIAKTKTSRDTKQVSSTSKQGYGGDISNQSGNSACQTKRKMATHTKRKNEHSDTTSRQSGSTSRKNPRKKKSASEQSRRNPSVDESKRPMREIYCPQYSDISNSQSIDENASPRDSSENHVETNFARFLASSQQDGGADFKRSGSDINANSLHVSTQVENPTRIQIGDKSMTDDDSDASDSAGDQDPCYVPPKKRKRYRKTSPDIEDLTGCTESSNSSSRSGHSLVVNGASEGENAHDNKAELKKVLLLEQAAIEKKLSKMNQKRCANGDFASVGRCKSSRQTTIDASVYDFDSDKSQSPAMNRRPIHGGEKTVQNGLAQLFANKTPTKSKSNVPNKCPGSGSSQRKTSVAARRQTGGTRGVGRDPPRRTSPRKHASTARLSGPCVRQLWQNGVKEEKQDSNGGIDCLSDTSNESDVLQMTIYRSDSSRNSSPLSNEDEVVLMTM